jgi:hypothetical protein
MRVLHLMLFMLAGATVAGVVAAQGTPARAARADEGRLQLAPGIFLTTTEPRVLRRLKDKHFSMREVTKRRWVTVRLREGRADVRVDAPREGLFVSDERGRGYALVVSGEVQLISTPQALRVVNRDARVLVKRDGHWRWLEAGQVFVTDGAREHMDTVPPAPTLRDGGAGLVSLYHDGTPTVVPVCWVGVPGALAYRASVTDERGARLAEEELPGEATCTEISLDHPGSYRVAVAAVDTTGIEGRAAATTVRLVRLSVPNGSFVGEHGHVRLSPGHVVTLEAAGGLELSATGRTWMPARDTVSATPLRPLRYLLRIPGSAQHAAFVVAMRREQIQVSIGPKGASWPRDAVRVVVGPGGGEPLPKGIEPVARVTIGNREVVVPWEREADTLRATIPAPRGPGPWVVHVEVADQYGYALGRDFAEIGGHPPRAERSREALDAGPVARSNGPL